MKYSERDKLVTSIRELADFVEEHGVELVGHLDVATSITLPYYHPGKGFAEVTPKEKKAMVKKLVRLLKPVKKTYSGTNLTITRKFGEKITLNMYVSRDVVCKAVKTGNKIVHSATVIPERIEDEIEWVCTDPLLKAS